MSTLNPLSDVVHDLLDMHQLDYKMSRVFPLPYLSHHIGYGDAFEGRPLGIVNKSNTCSKISRGERVGV